MALVVRNQGLDVRDLLDDCGHILIPDPGQPPPTDPGEIAKRCDCIERLGAAGFIVIEEPACDDADISPGGGGGPNPVNCKDLPRETAADCEAFASCIADQQFDDQIADVEAQIEALVGKLEDAEAEADHAFRIASRQLNRAVKTAREQAQGDAESRKRQIQADGLKGVLVVTVVGPGLGLIGGPGTATILAINGFAATAVIIRSVDAAIEGIDDDLATAEQQIRLVQTGGFASNPVGVSPQLWSNIMAPNNGLQAVALQARAAWDAAQQALNDFLAAHQAELDKLRDQLQELEDAKEALEENILEGCLKDLNPRAR